MCVAIPGRILSIENKKAKADFGGNVVTVNIGLVEAKEGDYVLVHAGVAIEVMKEERAKELIHLLRDLEEAANEGH